jgi:DNA-binding response OmpR family regulator
MKILLIEDDPKLGNSLVRGLTDDGYFVELCVTADEAVVRVRLESYDLLICDWMLPGKLDGVEFLKLIRDKNINTPCLMLTARSTVRDKVDGLNAGSDDFLTKPFAYDELLARVKSLLRRPVNIKPTVKTLGSLVIDDQNKSVTRSGKNVELSKKEWELLNYLLDNQNVVCSKSQIVNNVWGGDAEVLDNTVEVYIGYLRAKIDKPFPGKPNMIITVRGFGYKLVSDV